MLLSALRALAGASLALALVGCPVMIERDGHQVFNPAYTFALEGDDRDSWQKSQAVMDALAIGPGSRVADVGAGSGWFTERFSRRVGREGVVYAVDVQPAMLAKLRERVVEERLSNVRVIEASYDDAHLPPGKSDVVFFASVYKEIDDRVAYMKRLRAALATGGRVAIVEYDPEAEGPGPPKRVRLPKQTVLAELDAAGYRLVADHDFLPRHHFLVFE
jgi:arsenite methyltransferase